MMSAYKCYAYVSGGSHTVLNASGIERIPSDASVRLLIISQREENPAVLHMHDADGRLCGMTEHPAIEAAKLSAIPWFVTDTLEWRSFPEGIADPLFHAVRGLKEAASQRAT
jgi:hypothetical protein